MTKKELIDELKEYPDDATIDIWLREFDGTIDYREPDIAYTNGDNKIIL